MSSTPYSLAALATTAVPGLEIARVASAKGDPERAVAILQATDGRTLLAVVPTTSRALDSMRRAIRAFDAFTEGVRDRLPFEVPRYFGQTPTGKTVCVVVSRLGGTPLALDDLAADGDLPSSIGRAIAALHAIPTSAATAVGATERSAAEVRASALDTIDRAAATGMVPPSLLERWERAAEDDELWQFRTVVVHGDLRADALRRDGDTITGIAEWHDFGIGDPARDLGWLLGSPAFSSVDDAFLAYAAELGTSDRQLRQRAMLHAELDIAGWLLHGIEHRDQVIIDDAARMLHLLDARVDADTSVDLAAERLETMDLSGVHELLDRTEHRAGVQRVHDADDWDDATTDPDDDATGPVDPALAQALRDEDDIDPDPGERRD